MLDKDLQDQLKTYLEMVKDPIELVATLGEGPKSADLRALLEEIAALSDKVTARYDGTGDRHPSFDIVRVGTDIKVTFAGLPLGHEFTSLVLALLHVGGHTVKEDADTIAAIQSLEGTYEFTTYMSLECQNCPAVVQALNAMAVLNPRIRHTAVEGSLFQDEVTEKNILAVPAIYLNGELFGQGRMDAAQIVAKLDSGATERAAAKLNEKEPFEVLVVGGGPAGASAAVYTARKGIRTGLVAERFGGQVLDTMAIENFVSVPYTEGPTFAANLEQHVTQYEVDLVKGPVATKLIPAAELGGLHTVEFGAGTLKAKTVVLATGARWRHMGIPGEEEYRNKGVTFCPHCDGPLFKGKRIAVIGGGNSGIEAAIDLAGVVGHVTVIEFLDVLRADEVLVDKLKSLPNVDIIMNARTTEVLGDGTQVTGLTYEDRISGEIRELELQGIFVQIGLLPNTEWLKGAVELSERGEIVTDVRGATDIPGIFGAGDCTTVPYKQILIAEGTGATAALSAFDHLIRTSAPAAHH
ncbi:alkyl hydroperoxide reductase subunit F [Austwickia chelonae]|uniref:Alkyl hydroperoxide reductase subunit F n=1 Tax=Austwickia chelonae NBRC 105200 TaxID=1184607 RepID=K6V7N2_9MICO|nr:alkyl hydroperoxide reductase subunit F [Austwickia chelonae]GAB78238.1 alkyl hydroperoxide reductase subunit F [Austwickia chelonae NBRC 105200]SEV99373.1 alkyl hydroperoxide reductase subunit F [Austwickia chelonae]